MKLQRLEGIVERLTYVGQDGYTVLRLKVRDRADLVTVVGHLPDVSPGESLKLEGYWTSHAQYGRQFKTERCEQVLPATVEGIKRYLGSGMIKGIGPVTAARIVRRFGLDTLRVLDEEPRRLREVLGVGRKRVALIAHAWEAQKAIKVRYDSIDVGEYYADLIVENQVLVEIKVVKAFDEIHMAQCLNYLKATGMKVCLLLNFGKSKIEVKRIVNNL